MLTRTLLLSLLPLLALSAPSPAESTDGPDPNQNVARQSQNLIHLSNLFVACDGVCSWSFHLSGQDTPDIPGFGADCSGIGVPRGDTTFQNCQIVSQGSSFGKNLGYVQAYMKLRPRMQGPDSSEARVVFQVNGQGSTQYLTAFQTGQYNMFASGQLNEIDMVAFSYAGVA